MHIRMFKYWNIRIKNVTSYGTKTPNHGAVIDAGVDSVQVTAFISKNNIKCKVYNPYTLSL